MSSVHMIKFIEYPETRMLSQPRERIAFSGPTEQRFVLWTIEAPLQSVVENVLHSQHLYRTIYETPRLTIGIT